MGIRGIVQLAPSAFLASAAGTSELQDAILQNVIFDTPYRQVDACLQIWSERSQVAAPQLPEKYQKFMLSFMQLTRPVLHFSLAIL